MTHAQETEQKWVKRAIGLLVVLAAALFVVTTYSMIQTANDRAAAADRAERTAAELHVLADRLDRQAAALDRQASALEEQAAALQASAARADRSRSQFRAAAREILEQLGSNIDAFEVDPSPVEPAPPPERQATSDADPMPTPTPTPAETDTEPPGPGCVESGSQPKRCDGDGDG